MRPTSAWWLLLLLSLVDCGPRERAVEVPRGTPLILISIDTLRADHLPAYGHSGVATPAIDELARSGVVFENAYSHSPLTLPSHTSILTGLLPSDHRIRDNIGYPLAHDRVPLLQRALAGAGYATGGFVSSFVLRAASGLSTGFDTYDDGIRYSTDASLGGLQRPGADTLDAAVDWLRSQDRRPFFLFLHIYEPHSPYAPPEPFASRYASAYDGEIAAADEVVGQLLEELRRREIYDRSVIFLVSDHGEGLGEHGEQEHGVFLYRATTHVPLVMRLPGAQLGGTRVASPVQLVDLYPTALELAGLDADDRLAGTSLVRALSDPAEREIYAETFYPRLHFGWSDLASLVQGRFHYIDAPVPELFDMEADPAETRNLIAERADLGEALRERLARYDRTLERPADIDATTRKQLAALGYIGAAADPGRSTLPDPKLHVGSLEQLTRVARLLSSREYSTAVPLLRRLVEQQPQILDAREFLGTALEGLGREREALEVYRQAWARFPDSPMLSLAAARIYFRLGRLEDARSAADPAVPVDPAAACALLAEIALAGGDAAEAERQARRAMESRDPRPGAALALAHVWIATDRDEQALQLLQRTQASLFEKGEPDRNLLRGLSFLRGKALADLGEAQAAEFAFLQELRLFPEDPQAYTHLSALYEMLGLERDAVAVIDKLLRTNSSARASVEAVKALRLIGERERAEAALRDALERYPGDPQLRAIAAPAPSGAASGGP